MKSEQVKKITLKKRISEALLLAALPGLFSFLQRIYFLTLRIVEVGLDQIEDLEKNKQPYIYAVWHTNVLFTPIFARKRPAYVMISASRDGELITRVVRKFGHDSVRGSTTRGGLKALKEFIKIVKSGNRGAITPDGPLGPAFTMQDGVITAAIRSEAPIVPFYYEATEQWIVEKSWDKQRIPKPFSTVVISYGKPVYIPSGLDDDAMSEQREKLYNALMKNVRECQSRVSELKKSE